MKALTLTQPWATLVAIGAKKVETRSWDTRYRGPLAIHAAAGYPKAARALTTEPPFFEALQQLIDGRFRWLPDYLPMGAVVAVCDLVAVCPTEMVRVAPPDTRPPYIDHGLFVAAGELPFGDYSAGRFAWVLDNVRALPEPIPAKGALGLWTWEGA